EPVGFFLLALPVHGAAPILRRGRRDVRVLRAQRDPLDFLEAEVRDCAVYLLRRDLRFASSPDLGEAAREVHPVIAWRGRRLPSLPRRRRNRTDRQRGAPVCFFCLLPMVASNGYFGGRIRHPPGGRFRHSPGGRFRHPWGGRFFLRTWGGRIRHSPLSSPSLLSDRVLDLL